MSSSACTSNTAEVNSNNTEIELTKIPELLVRDLRAELEKRQLDKSGTKAVLVKRLTEAIIEEELNLSPTKTFDPNRKTELLDALIKEELKLNPIKDDYLEALIQEELKLNPDVNMKQNDTKNSNGQVSELEENTKMELSLCMEDNPEAPTIQVSSEIFENDVNLNITVAQEEDQTTGCIDKSDTASTKKDESVKNKEEVNDKISTDKGKDLHRRTHDTGEKFIRSQRGGPSRGPPYSNRRVEIRLRTPPRSYSGRVYYGNSSHRPAPTFRGRRGGVPDRATDHRLTFEQIRRTREETLRREEERRRREELNRKREAEERQRAIERRNQIELRQIEFERERLRQEREKVEREKQELIRLEKLRQQYEREKIEREREELRRVQLKLSQKRPGESERARYAGYPEVKERRLDNPRFVSSGSGSSDLRRTEGDRRVEPNKHRRDSRSSTTDRDTRSRGRLREENYNQPSYRAFRDSHGSRERSSEFPASQYKSSGKANESSVQFGTDSSQEYERKEFCTRADASYRVTEGSGDWSKNAYGSFSVQSASHGQVPSASSSYGTNRQPALIPIERRSSIRLDQPWSSLNNSLATQYPGLNRSNSNSLTQHNNLYNPQGHIYGGNVEPVLDIDPYKILPIHQHGQYRRF